MEFLPEADVPSGPDVIEYRNADKRGPIFAMIILAAGLAGVVYIFITNMNAQWRWEILVFGLYGLAILLVFRFAFRSFIAGLRRDAWLVRFDAEHLYIRYRSYHNWRFAADTPSVLHLQRREIASVAPHSKSLIHYTLYNVGIAGSSKRLHRYIEIGLRRVDMQPIKDALRVERQMRDTRGVRANREPLTVAGPDLLRLEIGRAGDILSDLSTYYPLRSDIEDAATETKGFAAMTDTERKAHVKSLAQSGAMMSAIKAVQHSQGLSLAKAKAYVEKLLDD
jgi:hypothetical protein